jgi:hypothetical protein
MTAVPGLAAAGMAGSRGDGGATITIGRGANDVAAARIPLVTHSTTSTDALRPPPSSTLRPRFNPPILPPDRIYRGGVPVTAPAPPASRTPGEPPGRASRKSPVNSSPTRPSGAGQPVVTGLTVLYEERGDVAKAVGQGFDECLRDSETMAKLEHLGR